MHQIRGISKQFNTRKLKSDSNATFFLQIPLINTIFVVSLYRNIKTENNIWQILQTF